MPDTINSQTLKQLRVARGLTQDRLAELCNCTKDTVSRWERGHNSRVRAHLRKPLCKALGTDWDALSRPPEKEPETRDDLVQISARICPETRNALQAVCERYKIDQRIVLEYAPLVFLILAEESLKRRRQLVDRIEAEIWAGYDSMREQAPYLGSYGPNISAEEAIEEERDAISGRNLSRRGCYMLDEERFDPFVTFLEERAAALPKNAVKYIAPTFAGYAHYAIAIDTIDEALQLDPSEKAEETNQIRDAITSGRIELRTAISQKSRLTESEFREWINAALAASEHDIGKSVREILDLVERDGVDTKDLVEAIKTGGEQDQ